MTSHFIRPTLLTACGFLLLLTASALVAQEPASEPTAENTTETPQAPKAPEAPEPPEATPQAPEPTPAPEARQLNLPADACAGGHIVDDGIVDKGFGFVSTSKWGMYVHKIESDGLSSRHLNTVCACFFQKPGGGDVDFEVVFFTAQGTQPNMNTYATVPGVAQAVGQGKLDAKWHAVDVSGVSIPEGTSYVGVRWKPTKEPRLYMCSDQTEATPVHDSFYGEDRSKGWINLKQTTDYIFEPHRALMIRATAHAADWEPPPAPAESAASATPRVVPKTE